MKQSLRVKVLKRMKYHPHLRRQPSSVVHVSASVVLMLALLIILCKLILQKEASHIALNGVVFKSHSRTIQSSWYKLHPWISACTSKHRVYCATSRAANDQGLLNKKYIISTFIHDGFHNWRIALEKFHEHEASNMHKVATQNLAAKAINIGINTQLRAQLRDDQKYHRSMFMKLHAIQFLSRQGLPFRGHKDDIELFSGNLYQLLLLQG